MRALELFVIYWDGTKTHLQSFLNARSGATAVEYVLLAAGIGIAILSGVTFYADSVSEMFTTVATEITE